MAAKRKRPGQNPYVQNVRSFFAGSNSMFLSTSSPGMQRRPCLQLLLLWSEEKSKSRKNNVITADHHNQIYHRNWDMTDLA